MARWLTYFKERFPLGVHLLLCGGIAVSCAVIVQPGPLTLAADGLRLAASMAGLLVFFAELRLMDEAKDHEKDKIAHPERPIPRGLLSLSEVKTAVLAVFFGMLIAGAIAAALGNPAAGALYALIAIYLWLMYKEFYLGSRLSSYPMIYAWTHQLVIIPICLFAAATVSGGFPDFMQSGGVGAFSVAVLGSFFTYEVCRKLDPDANLILKTYLSVYGSGKTLLIVLSLLVIAALGAGWFGAGPLLWPIEFAMALTSSLILLSPRHFKWIETGSALCLALHLWAPPLEKWLVSHV